MASLRYFRSRLLVWVLLCLAGSTAFAGSVLGQGSQQVLDVVRVKGIIDPVTADYLDARLDAGQADEVAAIVIQLDTPGGLDVSMRYIISKILESETPVVVWVAPRGARAASAGTYITYAADLAFMAETTELGAATPIDLSGTDLSNKIVNDAAAYLRSLAEANGRNVEWAEEAVREGASITATEAADIDVIDGVANSLGDLLRAMDGQTTPDGETIEAWDEASGTPSVTVRFQDMNVWQRLLHAVTGPEIAYLLLLVGFFGIIFELYNPGIGLAGIIGAVALLLGFYGLSVLPTNWVGVLLVVLAVVAFIVDLQIAGFGIWTIGGTAALIFGGAILFSGATGDVTVSPWAIVAAVAGSLIFFVSVMTAALRVRLRRPVTGQESVVGQVGIAKTDIAPEGMVVSKGILWKARTMETGIAAGEKVEIKATEGLVLLVEPLHDPNHVSSSESGR
ncbi:MAG: NfeD family protein [Actinomycetota bacterium]